ncbi:transposase [Nonomuraea sp. NPDC049480]|uniref:transposase n=1 Tax=Nonomuraea sp. NPDC049480 TaxID=3364353 RepID=UPI0037AFFDD9
MRFDSSSQARAATGYDRAAFTIDWTAKQATCPQGQTGISWTPTIQRGLDTIVVRFSAKTCTPCPARTECTSSNSGRRQITLRHTQTQQQALDTARTQQTSQDWQDKYKIRAGVEGTIRQAVAITGIRRARYRGLSKVHLEHVIAATALNLTRLDA